MKNHVAVLLLVLVCMLFALPCAGEEHTLYFPPDLTVIEDEAFFDCASIGKVVLHDQITHIGSQAFGRSSLTEINLPSSLVSIADDAFAGCAQPPLVTAEEGTYAYEWAARSGLLGEIPLSAIVIDLPSTGARRDILEGTYQIPYALEPAGAKATLIWESYDPEIATVDQNGVVTLLQAGYAYITVRDESYVHYAGVSLEVTGTHYTSEGLQFEQLADQSGYCVTGCEGDPQRIIIPATWQGLPVKGFRPGAFKNCTQLTDIALEDGHTVLYMDNDALYADLPEKTLLCYPGSHAFWLNYYITPGTKAIAPYAFAYSGLDIVTVPDSVVSIGDCAFYSLRYQLGVYMTDSVTEFGEALFQNQSANGYFYVPSWESPGALYANRYNIPCGIIIERTPEPTMAPTPTPAPTPMPDFPAVDEDRIAVYDELKYINLGSMAITVACTYDISALESPEVSEVRMEIQDQWRDLTYVATTPQTGLYGAGRTGQKAILRGYDRNGSLVGAKEISGDFTFAFDGACMLGVSGGSNTRMTVLPTRPVYVSWPGRYPIQPGEWHQAPGGNIYQHFILEFPRGMMNIDFPQHLNNLSYSQNYVLTGRTTDETLTYGPGYIICTACTNDASRVNQMNQVTLIFDYMEQLLSNADFSCYIASLPEHSNNLGESIYGVYKTVRAEMLKGHYPANLTINPVQVRIDGSYPSSYMSIVSLDSFYYTYDDERVCSIAHELIHAVDQGMPGSEHLPSAWMEGRAEYISKVICDSLGVPYTSSSYGEGRDYDWRFLSAEDRANFSTYYFSSTNRINAYPLGYYFYKFLIDTYGSSVGAAIMRNLADASFTYDNDCEVFCQCVENATEPGVFQRFITDVVIPSGT